MVATLEIDNNLGGAVNAPAAPEHNVANFRFNVEDTNDQDTNSPVDIPSGADNFSFWKHIFLHCTVAPDSQIDNMEIYTDGTLGFTDCVVRVNDDVCTKNSGSSAGYDPAVSGIVLTDHDTITTMSDLFSFTSGAPRTMTISEAGSVINASGELADYIVLNIEVGNVAVQGVQTPAELITVQWDEI